MSAGRALSRDAAQCWATRLGTTAIRGRRQARIRPAAPSPSPRRSLTTLPSPSLKPSPYGQPHPSTHPHLLRPAQLTPHFPASEYEERRRRLVERLPEGAVLIVMGGTVRLMSQQIFYRFRQSTNFHYLTGFDEPDSVLVLESSPSSPRGYILTLFVPPRDPNDAQWSGSRSGPEGATTLFGADEAFDTDAFSGRLAGYLAKVPPGGLFVELPGATSPSAWTSPYHPAFKSKRRASLAKFFGGGTGAQGSDAAQGLFAGKASEPPHVVLHAALTSGRAKRAEEEIEVLRAVKSRRELQVMKRAADISSGAHSKVMRFAQPGRTEADLAAHFEYSCALEGSVRPAYVPVVASGANALVIHYVNNDCQLQDGEMVLIDAGCEYAHYASDITRTFPVSGKFSDPQRDLYQAVLNAQKACIKSCLVQDEIGVNDLHRASCNLLAEELRQIGFKLGAGEVERKLYPHFLSHHLGSDLHDCPTRERNDKLVDGNVITIEPGIYVPYDSAFPKHFHGQGVRIEDEVAFTRDGPLVLSANAPKEVVDVEAVCQGVLEAL